MSDYHDYIEGKARRVAPSGFEPGSLSAHLMPFQDDIVRWAIRRGRAAIFADCGMGKTIMQLEWAHRVADHTNGRILILAPLAVATQTVAEGAKFGIEARYLREDDDGPGIIVTNYEMMDHFDTDSFAGVVLDESSILKSQDGKTRTRIIEAFSQTPYRLACTATPAPNDHIELGNHAAFLGIMSPQEMLSTYFVHDGGSTQNWRLKGHARRDFWSWVCSWAVMIRKPSDLGYDDGSFVLPPLNVHQITVESDATLGHLFAVEAETLQERIAARRESTDERCSAAADLVNDSDEPWIVWCGLNRESDLLSKLIGDAIEVRGSDSHAAKESALEDFSAGKTRVLVTKPSIAGFGMNWQHCARVAFVGLSDSWESYYQAVRRCWRFGQTRPVHVYIITATTEGAVVANIKAKEDAATAMAEGMLLEMIDITKNDIQGTGRTFIDYNPTKRMELPIWIA